MYYDNQGNLLMPQRSITPFLHFSKKMQPYSQFLQWLPLVPSMTTNFENTMVSYFKSSSVRDRNIFPHLYIYLI